MLFADDNNIFCSGECLKQLLQTMTSGIKNLKELFYMNKLSINVSKTEIVWFGKRKVTDQIQVIVDNVGIEWLYEYKFLGVVLDYKISLKPHIRRRTSKIAKSIAVLAKSRHVLNQESLEILSYSMVATLLCENLGKRV